MTSSRPDPVTTLTQFARALRAHGVTAGSGQVIGMFQAVHQLGATDIHDLYWAGRLTLVNNQWELATYDQVFEAFFGPKSSPQVPAESSVVTRELAAPGSGARSRPSQQPGHTASEAEALRQRDFRELTPEELEELWTALHHRSFVTEPVRTRRHRPARRGMRDDLRQTLREAMRTEGELVRRRFRHRRMRPRPLVLLLDVSGSMSDYSSALLRFAYAARRGAGSVEVLCFGTHIARVTDQLAGHDPATAIAAAAAEVFDWQGGTRIGESIHIYNRTWGSRTRFRGGVIVMCSDGLENGDPQRLGNEMARLRRLARRVVWVNPFAVNPLVERYPKPSVAIIRSHVDELVTGHNLASLEELASVLATG